MIQNSRKTSAAVGGSGKPTPAASAIMSISDAGLTDNFINAKPPTSKNVSFDPAQSP